MGSVSGSSRSRWYVSAYLIVAGSWAADDNTDSYALYTWDGNPAHTPAKTRGLPTSDPGSWEAVIDVPVGAVNANGTVNSKWNFLNSLPNGTYKMNIKDNATGKIASTTFAADFASV